MDISSPTARTALEAVRDALREAPVLGCVTIVADALDRALSASSAPQAVSSDGSGTRLDPSSSVPKGDAHRAFEHLRELVRLNRDKAHILQMPEQGFYNQEFPSGTSFFGGLAILANRAGLDVPEECREVPPTPPEATGESLRRCGHLWTKRDYDSCPVCPEISAARQEGRDAQRQADNGFLQTALRERDEALNQAHQLAAKNEELRRDAFNDQARLTDARAKIDRQRERLHTLEPIVTGLRETLYGERKATENLRSRLRAVEAEREDLHRLLKEDPTGAEAFALGLGAQEAVTTFLNQRDAAEARADAQWNEAIEAVRLWAMRHTWFHQEVNEGLRSLKRPEPVSGDSGASSAATRASDGPNPTTDPSSAVPKSDAHRAFYHLRELVQLNREKAHILKVPETGFYAQTFPPDTSLLGGLAVLANRAGLDVPEECREAPPAPEATGEGARGGSPFPCEAAKESATHWGLCGHPYVLKCAPGHAAALSAARQEGYEAGKADVYDRHFGGGPPITLGVGDGDTGLFVYGTYDAIKRAQGWLDQRDEACSRLRAIEAERDEARASAKRWRETSDILTERIAAIKEVSEARADAQWNAAIEAAERALDIENVPIVKTLRSLKRPATAEREDADDDDGDLRVSEFIEAAETALEQIFDQKRICGMCLNRSVEAIRSFFRPATSGDATGDSVASSASASDGSDPIAKPSSKVPEHEWGYGGTRGPKGAGPFKCRRCGTLTRSLAYEPALTPCISVREAARRRTPLDGADAQALEGALNQAEGELAAIREIVQSCAVGVLVDRPLSASVKRLVEAWQLAADDQDDITDAIDIREGEGVDAALDRTKAEIRDMALAEAEARIAQCQAGRSHGGPYFNAVTEITALRKQNPTAWIHPDAHAQESKRADINDARMGLVADLANRYGWADSEYDDAIEFVESLLFKGRDKLAEAERKADEAAKQLAEAVDQEREACAAELRRVADADAAIGAKDRANNFMGAANILTNTRTAWDRSRSTATAGEGGGDAV